MGMYMPVEETIRTAGGIGELPKEALPDEEPVEEVTETPRRMPGTRTMVVASLALSTAATAVAIAVRRRSQRRKARGIFAVTRRISLASPKVFVMFPLSAYVVNRNAPARRFRLFTRRMRALGKRRGAVVSQLERMSAMRERIPVGNK